MSKQKNDQDSALAAQPLIKYVRTLEGHIDKVWSIAFKLDGRQALSGSADKTLKVWDIERGYCLKTLEGHTDIIWDVALTLDGKLSLSGSADRSLKVWDIESGNCLRTLEGHTGGVFSVMFTQNGKQAISGSNDQTLKLWDIESGQCVRTFEGHTSTVLSVELTLDGKQALSGSDDKTLKLWEIESGQCVRTFNGHMGRVLFATLAQGGRQALSASDDKTFKLWDIETGQCIRTFEGHTKTVWAIALTKDGKRVLSVSSDKAIKLWDLASGQCLNTFKASGNVYSVAVDKSGGRLMAGLDSGQILVLHRPSVALVAQSAIPQTQYTNAKIVLVGDSGVGKSGLGLVLSDQPYETTESTHGRSVWMMESKQVSLDSGCIETRESLLWDLAGQPGYRIIHQLHLDEVAVALVVFDARSETDPFAGVQHWNRALKQAQRLAGDSALPMRKYLIAARTDRGGIPVSKERIESLVREMGFTGYFETSAKEGWGIEELSRVLREAIEWDKLPKVTSTELFQQIKEWLVAEKASGRLLSTADDLYRAFLKSDDSPEETDELPAQFATCVGRVESRGLIRRLGFGNLVLLQPEMLDAYAAALVNAARSEPDGLGCIAEEDARLGRFAMSKDERLTDKEQEKLLLIATVEDLLSHEVALRENSEHGVQLVFPSQFTRDNPDLPHPKGQAVIFGFEGAIVQIYATLAVRLSHSGLFAKDEMWRNAAAYAASVGGTCGIFLREREEGRGELTLFFDSAANEQTRLQFEQFILAHLTRRALPETVTRRRIHVCTACGMTVTDEQAAALAKRGKTAVDCFVCGVEISLLDGTERLAAVSASVVQEMDKSADEQREREKAKSKLEGKIATNDFDVFLCHNSADKPKVKEIGEKLKELGILPWLDEWNLVPGLPWQEGLEEVIATVKTAAVFLGPNGPGPWQDREIRALLRRFVKSGKPIIPVVLPSVSGNPTMPDFLEDFTWVDFRKDEADALELLVWGITGERAFRG